MLLDDLYMILETIYNKTTDIKKILEDEKIEKYKSSELIGKSDQEILDFLNEKDIESKKRDDFFDVIRNIKIEQSIDKISDENEIEDSQIIKDKIECLFGKILEPNAIDVNENKVSISYEFDENSKLKNKIKEMEKWREENVIETISNLTEVSTENITFIDSVSLYIDFISEFEESSYVSRGQRDCTYVLKPSLYRLYEDSFAGHSSDYEEAFKQKVLFYDKGTENRELEEIRAYGQHYGLPTNYLDFTEAHLISLLFAVEDYKYTEQHSVVYFVDAQSYNRDTIREDRKLIDFSDEELRKTVEKQNSDKSYFIKVGNCNERIHFQKGCFLKVVPHDTLEKMYHDYTKIVLIEKNSKESILKELFKLGITFENIYPDKDNMVKTIRFIKENM